MKILRRILLILLCVILVGYLAYKIAYPYVAPVLFDYLVDTNLDAFIKLEQSLSESLEEEPGDQPIVSDTNPSSGEEDTSPVDATPAPDQQPVGEGTVVPAGTSKPDTTIQSVKTTMGVFSGEHLARALKNMSPADKTRIISLCQSAVSTSDILKVSKMMLQDGLTKEQQKYIENYLRDNLAVESKREILEILQQY